MILVSEAGWRKASGLLAERVAPELPSTMMEENAAKTPDLAAYAKRRTLDLYEQLAR